ncbi:hypothetical protein [Chroococcidiopsis cubana]|nr:hypothetical protein [Chroococcidiopsis cubana]
MTFDLPMRIWLIWWNTLVFSCQHNPPQLIEMLMLLLATMLLGTWLISPHWSYQALAWSYLIGVSASMWIREAIAPTYQARPTQVIAVLLFILSLYGFADLFQYL